MLSLFQPSDQLMAALFIGAGTVSAALVNAMAQVKVAREARRNSKPVPVPSKRATGWLVVGTAVALGLGFSATLRDEASASVTAPGFISAGVTSMLGGTVGPVDGGGLIVASLGLSRALDEEDAVALLHEHGLRAYAVDVRLAGDAETWLPLPAGAEPAISLPRARAAAVRRAWLETCALEAGLVGVATAPAPAPAPTDSAAPVHVASAPDSAVIGPRQQAAAQARTRAERMEEERALIRGLRVLATPAAATAAAQDPAVAGAEIVRFDPGWPTEDAAPVVDGCEVVTLPGS